MSGRGRGGGIGGAGGGATTAASQSKLLLKRSAQEAGLDTDRQLLSLQEIIRPSLYPDFVWNSNGSATASATSTLTPNGGTTKIQGGHNEDDGMTIKTEEATDHASTTTAAATSLTTTSAQAPGNAFNVTKRPATVVAMIQKQRQLWEQFQKSCHNVKINQDVDIVRYGKQTVSTAPDQAILLSLAGNTVVTDDGVAAGAAMATTGGIGESTPVSAGSTAAVAVEAPTTGGGIIVGSTGMTRQSRLATDERYFPLELLSTQQQLNSAQRAQNPEKKTLTALLGEDLLWNDDGGGGGGGDENPLSLFDVEEDPLLLPATGVDGEKREDEEGGDDQEDEVPEEELEAEEVEDYTMNYYDSDVDSDGGGDEEPTF